jgi:hypothetical protein
VGVVVVAINSVAAGAAMSTFAATSQYNSALSLQSRLDKPAEGSGAADAIAATVVEVSHELVRETAKECKVRMSAYTSV